MAEYKRPIPKPYSPNDLPEAQLALSYRHSAPPPGMSKHDSIDDFNANAPKLGRTDSALSQTKRGIVRFFAASNAPTRKPTSERHRRSKRSRSSTKDRARRSRLGTTEDHGYDEGIDESLPIRRPVASDDESEEELSDEIDASSSEEDYLSPLAPLEGSSAALRKYVRDLTLRIKEKDGQINRLVKDLSHIQKADNYSRDDWHFIHSVQKLRELIKNWARMQKFQRSHLHSATREISIVGSSYRLFLTNPQEIAKLIQAFVWIQLQDHVFKLHRWAGDLCDKFQDLEDVLKPTSPVSNSQLVQFHEWRAITARLIDRKLTDENLPESTNVSEGLLRRILGSLAPEEKTDQLRFSHIVKQALELASEIAKQKSELCFLKINDFAEFDPDTMDDIMEDDFGDRSQVPRKVQLVTAPALVRFGGPSGEDYHVKTPVVKAEVVCWASMDQHQNAIL